MVLTNNAALMLADEPGLTGTDFRVWLCLVDSRASAADLARSLGIKPTNAAASCRKLFTAGWIDHVDTVGRSKLYRARTTRSQTAPLPGQTQLV